ncbi:MAG TPA: hypothetical protein VMW04_00670 [Patescibacteria group bacterium]|nr:hypothetical protein [Patescibacteria group bacterium]
MTTIEQAKIQEVSQSFATSMGRLSQEMAKGSMEAFFEMEELLDPQNKLKTGLEIRDLAGVASDELMASCFVARQVFVDLRENFGPGCIGYPPNLERHVFDIARDLGRFVQGVAFNQDSTEGSPIRVLGNMVKSYHSLLNGKEAQAREETGKGWRTIPFTGRD